MKDKAIKAIRKFFEDYGKAFGTVSAINPTAYEYGDDIDIRFTTSASVEWLAVECDHSNDEWYKQEPGFWADDRLGPYKTSEVHFIVKVTRKVSLLQTQVAFLNSLPKDIVLVYLKDEKFEEADEDLFDECLLEVDEAIKELTA